MPGNIEARGPGKWRLRVSAGIDPITRARNVVRVTFEGTRYEAEVELARLLVGVQDGGLGVGTTKTVGYLFDEWLPGAQLAERTRYNYRRSIELHLRKPLGTKSLRKLSTFDIDKAYRSMKAQGASADQIRYAHAVLRSALKQAIVWGWIATNPAANASPPPLPERNVATPNPAQVRKLAAVASDTLFRTAVAIHLASHLGARVGSICALQWDDFDLDAGTVVVCRKVDVVPGVGEIVKEMKGSRRRQRDPKPVDAATVTMMRLWDLATAEQRHLGLNPDGWVFQATRKGSFYRPDSMSADFKAVAREAGLAQLHMHSLRHYVATRLRDAGVDLDVISRMLSHSRTSTTVDMYGEKVSERAIEAALQMAKINRGAGA